MKNCIHLNTSNKKVKFLKQAASLFFCFLKTPSLFLFPLLLLFRAMVPPILQWTAFQGTAFVFTTLFQCQRGLFAMAAPLAILVPTPGLIFLTGG